MSVQGKIRFLSAALCISFCATLAAFFHAGQAFAVSENNYEAQMNAQVRPFYARGIDGSFEGQGGITIRYRKWEHPHERGAVVLLPGRGDAYATFDETIYDLAQKGYSVYTMDERGQGASQRMLANPQLGYVASFQDYVADLRTFLGKVVRERPHARTFLLAHSMGGAIATLYLEEYPSDFTAATLVTPMLRINASPFSIWQARLIARFELWLGRGRRYALTQHDYDPNGTFVENNRETTSEPRWRNTHEILRRNPGLQLGGVTSQWVSAAMKADEMIRENVGLIKTPILLLTAGDDKVVDVPEQASFCRRVPSCTQAPPYPGARHMLLSERDLIRNDALARIFEFFSKH